MTAAVWLDLPVTLHGVETAGQPFHFFVFNAKGLGNGRRGLQAACSTQDTENFLPAGDGVRVLAQMLI